MRGPRFRMALWYLHYHTGLCITRSVAIHMRFATVEPDPPASPPGGQDPHVTRLPEPRLCRALLPEAKDNGLQ